LNKIPRVAAINDLSGFGRCSLTVAIPILSVLGVQCCPIPTAILSCHTGFDKFFFEDLTRVMPEYISNWNGQNINFDAIYTGFLGSFEQIKIAEMFIKSAENKPICVIDTVMGDGGKIYPTYTTQMCDEMKKLVSLADVITPNVTEACYLTGTQYFGEDIGIQEAIELAHKLCEIGAKSVVITGIYGNNMLTNLVYENGVASEVPITKSHKCFSGTGDIFASIVTGLLCKGESLTSAVEVASKFISDAIENTILAETPLMEGVQFEPLLQRLGGDFYDKK